MRTMPVAIITLLLYFLLREGLENWQTSASMGLKMRERRFNHLLRADYCRIGLYLYFCVWFLLPGDDCCLLCR